MINVEIEGDEPLELDELDTESIAKALALQLKDAVSSQPGDRWRKTGALHAGIRANGSDVVIAGDRLQDDDVRQRFADEVMPADPTADARVKAAEERAVTEALVKKG